MVREFVPPADSALPADKWLHYDAAALALADNAAVAAWNDASVNARNLAQATAGQQPVFKVAGINGLPAVLFDGVNDTLATAHEATVNGPFTMLAVLKPAAAPASLAFLALLADVGAAGNPSVIASLAWGVTNSLQITGGVVDANPHILAVVFATGAYEVAVDGRTVAAGAMIAPSANGFRLGALNAAGALPWGGLIGELALYNRAFDERDLALTGRFLQRKWGTPAGGF